MEETIHGTTMPVLEISLQPGESVVSEAGEFSWMSDAIQFATNTGGGMGGKGIMGAVKRAVAGASVFMTTYTAQGGPGSIAFASKVPGHILPIDVAPGNEFMVHRHGFMAGTPGIQLAMGFQQSLRGGIFGGEGLILQKISWRGPRPGSISRARSSSTTSNPDRRCGCIRATPGCSRPRSPSRCNGCRGWRTGIWARTATTSPC